MKEVLTSDPANHRRLCAEALDPFGDGLQRGVELARRGGLAQSVFRHTAHHGLSTFRRQRSILVGVHSVLRESLVFGDFSVRDQGRMDNLLKVHSLTTSRRRRIGGFPMACG